MITICVLGLFANPSVLFAHKYEEGGIGLYADHSLDEKAVKRVLRRVSEAMAASPLGASDKPYTLFSSKSAWREALFFGPVPRAGGAVYPPLSRRHGFLTAIDRKSDRLPKGSAVIQPPRTPTFYMVHELTQIRMHEMARTIGFYLMPHWMREGLPDYVALGPVAPQNLLEIVAWDGPRFDLISRFGAYPKERAAVSFAIHHLGIAPTELMSSKMDFSDVQEKMHEDGFEGAI